MLFLLRMKFTPRPVGQRSVEVSRREARLSLAAQEGSPRLRVMGTGQLQFTNTLVGMRPSLSQPALNNTWCLRAGYPPPLVLPLRCSSSCPPSWLWSPSWLPEPPRKDLFSNIWVHITGFWRLLRTSSHILPAETHGAAYLSTNPKSWHSQALNALSVHHESHRKERLESSRACTVPLPLLQQKRTEKVADAFQLWPEFPWQYPCCSPISRWLQWITIGRPRQPWSQGRGWRLPHLCRYPATGQAACRLLLPSKSRADLALLMESSLWLAQGRNMVMASIAPNAAFFFSLF